MTRAARTTCVEPDLYATDARIIARADDRALAEGAIPRGFRHQVRAHLAFLGYPILGDALYGAPVPRGIMARMYLHAVRIELPHPETGRRLVVESPLPGGVRKIVPVDRMARVDEARDA